MLTRLLSSLIVVFPFVLMGQAPPIQWQNSIGGEWIDNLHAMTADRSGGFVLVGNSASSDSCDKTTPTNNGDYWIVKIDSTGQNVVWQRTIGSDGVDEPSAIIQTQDGGFAIGGISNGDSSGNKSDSSRGGYDFWIVKLDSTGQTLEWERTLGGNALDRLYALTEMADGGIVVGGLSNSDSTGDKNEPNRGFGDYWIVKLSADGQLIEWQNTIGGNQIDELSCLLVSPTGSFIVGGTSSSGASIDKTDAGEGSGDFWVFELDSTGMNILWQNSIGGGGYDQLFAMQYSHVGTLLLGGRSNSGISGDKSEAALAGVGLHDFWALELSASGQTVLWNRTIGSLDNDMLTEIDQFSNGDICLIGHSDGSNDGMRTDTSRGSTDMWIVALDSASHNILWQRAVGGNLYEYANAGFVTPNDQIVVAGYTASFVSGELTEDACENHDYWIFQLGITDTTDTTIALHNTLEAVGFAVYPNPFNDGFWLENSTAITATTAKVLDVYGRLVAELTLQPETRQYISLANVAPGTYTLVLREGQQVLTERVIKLQ